MHVVAQQCSPFYSVQDPCNRSIQGGVFTSMDPIKKISYRYTPRATESRLFPLETLPGVSTVFHVDNLNILPGKFPEVTLGGNYQTPQNHLLREKTEAWNTGVWGEIRKAVSTRFRDRARLESRRSDLLTNRKLLSLYCPQESSDTPTLFSFI